MSIKMDELEARMFNEHTERRPIVCEGWPETTPIAESTQKDSTP